MFSHSHLTVSPGRACIDIGPSRAAAAQAINGTIEGTVVDDQGAVLPASPSPSSNVDTGDARVVVTNESGLYRAPLLAARHLPGRARSCRVSRNSSRPAVTLRAGQTAVINVKLIGRRRRRDDHRYRRFAGRRPGQDRARPHADRSGNQDPAAHLAQSLQLRAPAARRRRLRNQ